jgi:hypothetical protein
MTLTASRHHKRSIALTMLLVWVFALLSGVANACLTEPRGELAHAGIQVSQADQPAPAAVRNPTRRIKRSTASTPTRHRARSPATRRRRRC